MLGDEIRPLPPLNLGCVDQSLADGCGAAKTFGRLPFAAFLRAKTASVSRVSVLNMLWAQALTVRFLIRERVGGGCVRALHSKGAVSGRPR